MPPPAEARATHVLLVEDDIQFGQAFADYLAQHGLNAIWIQTVEALDQALPGAEAAVLVLDQFIGRHDLVRRLPELRLRHPGGIMLLSANTDPVDRVIGIENGADDYVSKSVGPREILARIRALARRTTPPAETAPPAPATWTVDDLRRDVVTPNGTALNLTGLEYETFVALHSQPGQVITRETLTLAVFGRDANDGSRALDNLVSRVRQKLRHHSENPDIIRAVRSKGYSFTGF